MMGAERRAELTQAGPKSKSFRVNKQVLNHLLLRVVSSNKSLSLNCKISFTVRCLNEYSVNLCSLVSKNQKVINSKPETTTLWGCQE